MEGGERWCQREPGPGVAYLGGGGGTGSRPAAAAIPTPCPCSVKIKRGRGGGVPGRTYARTAAPHRTAQHSARRPPGAWPHLGTPSTCWCHRAAAPAVWCCRARPRPPRAAALRAPRRAAAPVQGMHSAPRVASGRGAAGGHRGVKAESGRMQVPDPHHSSRKGHGACEAVRWPSISCSSLLASLMRARPRPRWACPTHAGRLAGRQGGKGTHQGFCRLRNAPCLGLLFGPAQSAARAARPAAAVAGPHQSVAEGISR